MFYAISAIFICGNCLMEKHKANFDLRSVVKAIVWSLSRYIAYAVSDSSIAPRTRYLIDVYRMNEQTMRSARERVTPDICIYMCIYTYIFNRRYIADEERRPSSSFVRVHRQIRILWRRGRICHICREQSEPAASLYIGVRSAPCKRHDGHDKPGSRGVGYRYLESADDVSRRAHQEATGQSAGCCVIWVGTQDACLLSVDRFHRAPLFLDLRRMNIRERISVRLIEHLIINNRKTKVYRIDET